MLKSILIIVITVLNFSNLKAQSAQLGITGGLNYNFSGELSSLDGFGNEVVRGLKKSNGYHAGGFFKLDFEDIYLKSELFYTQFETEFEGTPTYSVETKKIDVPITIGFKIIGPLYVFAGPDFQYILDEDFSLDDTTIYFDKITTGLHLGAGVEIGKFSIDVRWDKGLSGSDSKIVTDLDEIFNYDNRPNQIILGLNIVLTD